MHEGIDRQAEVCRELSLDEQKRIVTPVTVRDQLKEMHDPEACRPVAEESPRPTQGDGKQSIISHAWGAIPSL